MIAGKAAEAPVIMPSLRIKPPFEDCGLGLGMTSQKHVDITRYGSGRRLWARAMRNKGAKSDRNCPPDFSTWAEGKPLPCPGRLSAGCVRNTSKCRSIKGLHTAKSNTQTSRGFGDLPAAFTVAVGKLIYVCDTW